MDFDLGIYKVRTSMKRLKLVAKRPKQHHYPSNGKASVIAPNHLNRLFNPEHINTLWSGDITYTRTHNADTEHFFCSLKSERVNYRLYHTR